MNIYDTNLSYRMDVMVGRYQIVIDWWYDVSSRKRRLMPLEARIYGTKKHLDWVANHQARFQASQRDGLVEALREIDANAYFFYVDNTEMLPSYRDLFLMISDRAQAALKAAGAYDPNTLSAQHAAATDDAPGGAT